MLQSIISNWNFFRIVRVALGIFIIIQGSMSKDFLSIGLGALFAGLALFNVGCCGSGGCSTDLKNNTPNKEITDIEYEEVVSK